MKYALLIGLGSFVGGIARFYLGRLVHQLTVVSFPFGTMAVNIIGSLLIGVFIGLADRYVWFTYEWRMLLMVGFCGSFTTFSTFAGENVAFLREGQYLFFSAYTLGSVVFALISVVVGLMLVRLF
jgi:CrcB protein